MSLEHEHALYLAEQNEMTTTDATTTTGATLSEALKTVSVNIVGGSLADEIEEAEKEEEREKQIKSKNSLHEDESLFAELTTQPESNDS